VKADGNGFSLRFHSTLSLGACRRRGLTCVVSPKRLEEVGFDLKRGKVTEAPPDKDDERGGTSYGPPIDADDPARG
jgi:hypothetical protein